MTAILIDDEQRARVSLRYLLNEYCPEVEILEECENLSSGVKAIIKKKPNLVFLDIEMPGHSGLELLDFFDDEDIKFQIIFTTAYNEFALKAFKLSAVDYLLKPIDELLLQDAVKRASKIINTKHSYEILKENILSKSIGKIAIPSGSSLLFIETKNILYIRGDGSYTVVVLKNGTKHTVSRNLKNFEETIEDQPELIRIHKSYIVNVNEIVSYTKSEGGSIELTNKEHLPITNEKVEKIIDLIKVVKR
ncbi:LytR/AlgR family response regulator transcription factor [Flavobacterium proteolyticum]|uniref:Response regulator transcription factor n=1 Tax=Flavobacterium proteolyticum TaxID=2911683 RepID=A0ABR9WRL3_9FLAO|nr:LytTR family DNA-binding domain-containing protein [Flavobacterium proteolyticum]MBE9576537.1 response regulator transcription factor [Flavobacterium proteolyticum]